MRFCLLFICSLFILTVTPFQLSRVKNSGTVSKVELRKGTACLTKSNRNEQDEKQSLDEKQVDVTSFTIGSLGLIASLTIAFYVFVSTVFGESLIIPGPTQLQVPIIDAESLLQHDRISSVQF